MKIRPSMPVGMKMRSKTIWEDKERFRESHKTSTSISKAKALFNSYFYFSRELKIVA